LEILIYFAKIFYLKFIFITSFTTEIMAARRQINLTTMRLSLLHPLGTMSHRARGGPEEKKQTKRLVNLKEKKTLISKL